MDWSMLDWTFPSAQMGEYIIIAWDLIMPFVFALFAAGMAIFLLNSVIMIFIYILKEMLTVFTGD